MALHLHHGIPRRASGTVHTMRMAHHPHDSWLFPQKSKRQKTRAQRCHHLRHLHHCHLHGAGRVDYTHLRCTKTQRARHRRRVQRLLLLAAGGLRTLLLRMVRAPAPIQMGRQGGQQSIQHQRIALNLPHGIHLGAGLILLHGTYRRTTAC